MHRRRELVTLAQSGLGTIIPLVTSAPVQIGKLYLIWQMGNRMGALFTSGYAATILLLATTVGANAQLSPHWRTCTGNPDIGWDQQIKSCTILIESKSEATENVAIAFFNRALAYENKDDYVRAIADYTESIRWNPKDADAFFLRSLCKQRTGDKLGADADMVEARRLNPNIGR